MNINHQALIRKLVKLQGQIQKIRKTNNQLEKLKFSSLLDGMIFLIEEVNNHDRESLNLKEAVMNLKSQLFLDGGKGFYIDETKLTCNMDQYQPETTGGALQDGSKNISGVQQ